MHMSASSQWKEEYAGPSGQCGTKCAVQGTGLEVLVSSGFAWLGKPTFLLAVYMLFSGEKLKLQKLLELIFFSSAHLHAAGPWY